MVLTKQRWMERNKIESIETLSVSALNDHLDNRRYLGYKVFFLFVTYIKIPIKCCLNIKNKYILKELLKNLHKGLFKYYITHFKGEGVNCGCEKDVRKKSHA